MKTIGQKPLFPMGQLLATPGAFMALARSGEDLDTFLKRHMCGDWGEVHPEDQGLNEEALVCGSRIMSVYYLKNATRIWIITEADRSATTVLLPEEY